MIRPATADDVPAILELIRELARYEREPDAVHTSEADLYTALFGPHPLVHALIATDDGLVVGCAVWFVSFSTWTGRHGIYLEDLVVRQQQRGAGHGRQLMAALARICLERGYARLEWTVLDWNESALRFYRSLHAAPMAEWTAQRVTGEALHALAAAAG